MIPVDSTRMQPIASGNINPVMAWITNPDGSRNRSDQQALDEHGQPLWNIEILRTTRVFGEERTQAVPVQVPAPTQPQIKALTVIKLDGLEADFYVSKGQLRERWTATTINGGMASAPQGGEK